MKCARVAKGGIHSAHGLLNDGAALFAALKLYRTIALTHASLCLVYVYIAKSREKAQSKLGEGLHNVTLGRGAPKQATTPGSHKSNLSRGCIPGLGQCSHIH